MRYCLWESGLADRQCDFDTGVPILYDKRWNAVWEFCTKTRPQLQIL